MTAPAQHTPGPWLWEEDMLFAAEGTAEDYEGKPIRATIVETDSGVYPPFGADRNLIAAAPDLLAACKQTVIAMDTTMSRDTSQIPVAIVFAWNNLRAAIARAEGGQP